MQCLALVKNSEQLLLSQQLPADAIFRTVDRLRLIDHIVPIWERLVGQVGRPGEAGEAGARQARRQAGRHRKGCERECMGIHISPRTLAMLL